MDVVSLLTPSPLKAKIPAFLEHEREQYNESQK